MKPEMPPTAKPVAPPADQSKKAPSLAPAPHAGGSVGGSIGGVIDGAFAAVVKLWCAKTRDPDLCFTSIKPLIGTIKVPHDATGVLKLAMEALRAETDAAIKTAKKYVADPKTDKMTATALHDCLEMYDDAEWSLDKVDGALQRSDKGLINSLLSSVGTSYDTCENGFDDFEITSLMADVDKRLMAMDGICLTIAAAADLMAV
jgi:pectinesterase inhibitor-like protein